MQFLIPHKMSFGDNSNVINAPIVTSEVAEESPTKERLRTRDSQEENYNENKQKSKDIGTRQYQGSPLSNFNDKKSVLEHANDQHQDSVVSQTGVKRSAERFCVSRPQTQLLRLTDSLIMTTPLKARLVMKQEGCKLNGEEQQFLQSP